MTDEEVTPDTPAQLREQLAALVKERDYYRRQVASFAGEQMVADKKSAYLTRQLQQAETGLALLTDVHTGAAGLKNDDSVLVMAAEAIAARLHMDKVAVLRLVPDAESRNNEEVFTFSSIFVMGSEAPANGFSFSRDELYGRQALLVAEGTESAPVAAALAASLAASTLAAVPVLVEGEAAFVLAVGRAKRMSSLTDMPIEPRNVEALRAVAEMIGATVASIRKDREMTALEMQMSGGFAHEMRNSLSAARLMLASAYDDSAEDADPASPRSLSERSGQSLKTLLLMLRESTSAELFARVVETVRPVVDNERRTHDIIEVAKEATERALHITKLIMDYSRLGVEQAGSTPLNVAAIVADTLRAVGPMAGAANVELSSSVEAGVVVVATETHLFSVLMNLVKNAIEACSELPAGMPRTVAVGASADGDDVVLSIRDQGPGMDDATVARIFEPFFTTKPDTGTGLGLGVVRKIVDLYRGSFTVASRVGTGTTFTIRLPLSKASP